MWATGRRYACTVACIGCLPVQCLCVREEHLAVLQYKGSWPALGACALACVACPCYLIITYRHNIYYNLYSASLVFIMYILRCIKHGCFVYLGAPWLEARDHQNIHLAGLRKARTRYARSSQSGDRSTAPPYRGRFLSLAILAEILLSHL